MNILEYVKSLFTDWREKPAPLYGIVRSVEDQEGGYRLTVEDAEGVEYSIFMPKVHPYAGAIMPRPEEGARAHLAPLELASRPMKLCSYEVGDRWYRFPWIVGV